MLVHWHGYITVSCFSGADGFFLGFCLYLTVLLLSLRDDVCDLLEVKPGVEADELQIVREMERLIDRHNEVAELTKRLSGIMVEITLGHFVTSSLIIGTSVLDMLLVRISTIFAVVIQNLHMFLFKFSGVGIIVYLVYTLAVGTEIFLYCLGGTCIMEAVRVIGSD